MLERFATPHPERLLTASCQPRGTARISFTGGALLMPARRPYDRAMVFEAAASHARRHGCATVEIDGVQIVVRLAEGQTTCADCGREIAQLLFVRPDGVKCGRCVDGRRAERRRAEESSAY
jgi:hypothetical protein